MNKSVDLDTWKRIRRNGSERKKRKYLINEIRKPTIQNIVNISKVFEQSNLNWNNSEELSQNRGNENESSECLRFTSEITNDLSVNNEASTSSESVSESIYGMTYDNWDIELEPDEYLEVEEKSEMNLDRRLTFIADLAGWSAQHGIKQMALNDLLAKLNKNFPELHLPKDSRTIMSTPQKKVTLLEDGHGGSYWHYGLEKALRSCLNNCGKITEVKINVNIDGLPLYRSSKMEFWPILINIHGMSEIPPVVVGIYAGKGKNFEYYLLKKKTI